ncbi:hypothetical protein [Saprospira grandis]|uniref:hypothetical protein n=1 Tax=Saprospira grandis TaxID=1008 RepID=UPI0022DE32A7|nr:hypothetical protein [Saprospira grandis]WBM74465.1 hypothetical protein OP864_15880 [Saprospira grandis]
MKRFSLSTCYLFLSVLLFGQWQDAGTDLMHYVESKRSLALGQNGQQLAVSEQGIISIYYWDSQAEDWRQKGSQIIDSSAWDVIAMSEDGLTLAQKCSYADSSGREIGYV